MTFRLTPTVRCEVCFERFKLIAGSHLKKHGHNTKSYQAEFKDAPVISNLTKRKMQIARLKYILKKTGKISHRVSEDLKQSVLRKRRPHSAETRRKMSLSHMGKKLSEEHKLAISAKLLGRPLSEEHRAKLGGHKLDKEHRRHISEAQSADNSNSWKGGRSRWLYQGHKKFRLKKIFGTPLKCFFPGCDKIEGVNVKSVDCHHLDGNHENNPLDGMNWLPLCRSHHMLADGRLMRPDAETEAARKAAFKVHKEWMKDHYIGEIKTYFHE